MIPILHADLEGWCHAYKAAGADKMGQFQHFAQIGLNRRYGGRWRAAASLHMTLTAPMQSSLYTAPQHHGSSKLPKAMAAACMLSMVADLFR
jgi:hypothetical protein